MSSISESQLLMILNVSIDAIERGETTDENYDILSSNLDNIKSFIDWENLPEAGQNQIYDTYLTLTSLLESRQ